MKPPLESWMPPPLHVNIINETTLHIDYIISTWQIYCLSYNDLNIIIEILNTLRRNRRKAEKVLFCSWYTCRMRNDVNNTKMYSYNKNYDVYELLYINNKYYSLTAHHYSSKTKKRTSLQFGTIAPSTS